jgi:hypothetical protein
MAGDGRIWWRCFKIASETQAFIQDFNTGGVAARLGVRKPRRRRRRVASAAGARIEALAPRGRVWEGVSPSRSS